MVLVGLRYGLYIIYEYVYNLLFHVYLGTLVTHSAEYIHICIQTHTHLQKRGRTHTLPVFKVRASDEWMTLMDWKE